MSEPTPEGFVTLYNPESGDPWNSPAEAVDDWTAKGWRKTDPKKSTSPTRPPAAKKAARKKAAATTTSSATAPKKEG
jgi:hypothetical protein